MTRAYSILVAALGFVFVASQACGDSSAPVPEDAAKDSGGTSDDCAACLESGGTWQPETSSCTEDCDIVDASCFRTECPRACEDRCENCFDQAECEAQGCTWRVEAEAMWCVE